MSPEKEAALVKAFPHLYRDINAPMSQSAMCWGFQCLDGWYDIIYAASAKLEQIIMKMMDEALKTNNLEMLDFIPVVNTVKEKYATLQIYITNETEEMDQITQEAEKKSEETCERCGAAGKLRGTHWYFIRCDSCWNKQEADRGA